jgi:hypothetical protein
VLHRFAGFDESGEVEDTVEGSVFSGRPAKEAFNLVAIGDVGFYKFDPSGDEIAAGVAEVVDDNDLMSLTGEKRRNCSADVSGTSSNHDLHKNFALYASI